MTTYDGLPADGPNSLNKASKKAMIILFICTLMVPASLEILGLRLSPIRIFLLIATIPCIFKVMSGRFGRVTIVDTLFLLLGSWIILSLSIVHGLERFLFSGITTIELLGGYFVGRTLIRSGGDYRQFILISIIAILTVLPFAIFESFTGKIVISDILRPLFDTPTRAQSAYGRMGLERTYVVFDHPILWGLFCSIFLANLLMLVRTSKIKVIFTTLFVTYVTMLSLSSAPLLSCVAQLALLIWGWATKGRWILLMILSIVSYIAIDLASNRTPITILIDTMTFNPATGWIRIAIFDYGWAAVLESPFFGNGFNEYYRPSWLTSSVDNFWLLMAIRYGLLGSFLTICAFASHIILASAIKVSDPELSALRTGHIVALVGIVFTLVTVHIWGAVSVFVTFYLGAGAWIYTSNASQKFRTEKPPKSSDARMKFTRFP